MKSIATIFCCFLLAASSLMAQKESASKRFENAYRLLIEADNQRDANKPAKAITLYKEAIASYRTLSSEYPDWQSRIVQFRLTYCTEQLDELVKEFDAEKKASPPLDKPDSALNKLPAGSAADGSRPVNKFVAIGRILGEATDLIKKNNPLKAQQVLVSGLELDPDHHEIRYLLALAQCRSGNFKDASYILEGLLDDDPEKVSVLTLLGTTYYATGNLAKAKATLKKAITLDPKSKEGFYNLAQVVIDSKPQDLKLARALYKRASKLGAKSNKKLEAILKAKPAEE